MVEPKSKF